MLQAICNTVCKTAAFQAVHASSNSRLGYSHYRQYSCIANVASITKDTTSHNLPTCHHDMGMSHGWADSCPSAQASLTCCIAGHAHSHAAVSTAWVDQVIIGRADLLFGEVLRLQPQQAHELAQPLLCLQGQPGDAPQAQPGMHALMGQNGASQQPWQAIQHQNGCHLNTPTSALSKSC